MTVVGELAYVLSTDSVQILDVSNPEDPRPLGVCSGEFMPYTYDSFALQRSHLYVLSSLGQITVIDASSTARPRVVGKISLESDTQAIALHGDALFAAGSTFNPHGATLRAYKLLSPTNAASLGPAVNLSGEFFGLSISDGILYAATSSGVTRFDANRPEVLQPHVLTKREGDSDFLAAQVKDGFLYQTKLSRTTIGLFTAFEVYRVTNHTATRVGALPLESQGFWPGRILREGRYVYLTQSDGVLVIDLDDPERPALVGKNSAAVGSLASGHNHLFILSSDHMTVLPFFQPRIDFGNSRSDGDRFALELFGTPRSRARIQRSTDLRQWEEWQPVSFGEDWLKNASDDVRAPRRFYRTVSP